MQPSTKGPSLSSPTVFIVYESGTLMMPLNAVLEQKSLLRYNYLKITFSVLPLSMISLDCNKGHIKDVAMRRGRRRESSLIMASKQTNILNYSQQHSRGQAAVAEPRK